MAGVADRWIAGARTWTFGSDYFKVAELLDTTDGVVVLLNREGDVLETEPPPNFCVLLKLSRDAKVLWRIAISALDPSGGPTPISYNTKGVSVTRATTGPAYYVVGTATKNYPSTG